MRRILKTAVPLILVAALVIPSVALAGAGEQARAQERYYSSYGKPTPIQPRTVAAESGDAGDWKLVAIGAGVLVLALGAVELVTLARLRALRTT